MSGDEMDSEKSLIVFKNYKIRRIWHDDECNYSVSDMIAVLTDSNDELALEKTKVKRNVTLRHQRVSMFNKKSNYSAIQIMATDDESTFCSFL